tara:strand:+ start:316 stop:510 length:195 start_codon:yes stop_codon:yes gene_type:complete
MTNRKTPTSSFSISELQQTNRGILVDNRWAFVFSTDIQDWITQRARKQQFESRKRIKNGKRKEG